MTWTNVDLSSANLKFHFDLPEFDELNVNNPDDNSYHNAWHETMYTPASCPEEISQRIISAKTTKHTPCHTHMDLLFVSLLLFYRLWWIRPPTHPFAETQQNTTKCDLCYNSVTIFLCDSSHAPLIARLMGPTWGPSGADRTHVGPMNLAIWAVYINKVVTYNWDKKLFGYFMIDMHQKGLWNCSETKCCIHNH